ncbi:MAG: glycoside hydrolase family 113 [Planctomycetota bacterium]
MLRRSWFLVVAVAVAFTACTCRDDTGAHHTGAQDSGQRATGQGSAFAYRGAWLAPRADHPLDSEEGSTILRGMRALGIRQVAVGHDVNMPKVTEPHLTFGQEDDALRGFLRRARQEGLQTFLLPRIESPDFFRPPYPFRGDIRFGSASEWDRFHDDMERMILHYARLAQEEGVALLGLGLELKHSVRGHAQRWRQIIQKVRKVYAGKITYSANWWSEWEHVTFWDALDFIGIGAYFELHPQSPEPPDAAPGTASRQQLVARWRPIREQLRRVSNKYGRRVLFTEVGYAGYEDCAERPWEWAGKQEKGTPIDHGAQARAFGALLDVVAAEDCLAGLFAWRFYTNPGEVAAWEYALQGRPAEEVLRKAYRAPR